MSSLNRDDQIFLGAGLLAFIFTFIAFAHISIGGLGSDTVSAWHGIGTVASLLLLAALVVGAVVALAPSSVPRVAIGPRVIATGLAALAFLFFIIRWITLPSGDVLGHHYGYNLYWGGYILLILNLVMIACGYRAAQAAGEAMPWENRSGAAPPPDPTAPGTPPTV